MPRSTCNLGPLSFKPLWKDLWSKVWHCFNNTPPPLQGGTNYARFHPVFPDKATFRRMCTRKSITWSPGIEQMLMSETPPTFSRLSALPEILNTWQLWGIYSLLFTKPEMRPRVYVGQCCQTQKGFSSRKKQAHCLSTRGKPTGARASILTGYKMERMVLLMSMPKPPTSGQTKVWAMMKVLECALAHILGAMAETVRPQFTQWQGF